MPRTKKTHAPRTGRPRAREGDYKIVMLRWPAEVVEDIHAQAAAEMRSINAVLYRMYLVAREAEGRQAAPSTPPVETVYSSS